MNPKKEFIKIEYLLVNPKNFRFDPVANQKRSYQHYDKQKAEDIAKYGLNPIETLAVTKTYREKYMVWGL
ncbi:MAG: hypothetical protein OXN83_01425 [Oligoflexia bacterium]|nr:hypothetical protein [Oligoflexia bacterium]